MKAKYDIAEIQKLYDSGFSLRMISNEIGISLSRLAQLSKQGKLITRSSGEANIGRHHSPETKQLLRDLALKQGFGGYNANAGRSKREYRKDCNGKDVLLQSSYETRFADMADALGLKWVRPDAITYVLDGKERRYYPDFLVDNKFFVDTKNSYLVEQDKPKISAVEEQNSLSIVILLEKDLTEDVIKSLFMVL